MFKLKKYLICLLTVLFTFNFVLADSTTDVFIKNQIENAFPEHPDFSKGEGLISISYEEMKGSIRSFVSLGKDEEILFVDVVETDTGFLGFGGSFCWFVITDQSINFVWNNDKPNESLKIYWNDIVNVEYKDMCLYIDATGAWKDGERIDSRQIWQVHLSYLTNTKDRNRDWLSYGQNIAYYFNRIPQYLREKDENKYKDI